VSPWRRRDRARGAAALRWLAVLVALCQGAAWVHAAATPHVTCLEHGESVHLAPRDNLPQARRLAVVDAPAEPRAHGHEHCGLQAQGSATVGAPQSIAQVETPPAIPTPTVEPRPVTGLLRLAPKTSPPRAPAA
jgi:hypothetical protein